MKSCDAFSRSYLGRLAKARPATWLVWSPLLAACVAEELPPNPPDPPAAIYRIDHVDLETDGVDLDGDGRIDNRAGPLLRTLLDVHADLGLADAWLASVDAALADRVVWTVDDAIGDRGDGSLPLGLLADLGGYGADIGWHATVAMTHRVVVREGEATGWIAGALAPGYRRTIAEAILPLVAELADDGSVGWADQVDDDGDGVIELDELLADPTFQWLTRPDLGDGLSFAFRIHATEVDADR
jgi:hypothetical protein